MVVSRLMQADPRYPVTWEPLLKEEDALANRLCGMFAELRPKCADLMRAGDVKAKAYHDRTTLLLELGLLPGDLVYRCQR